MARRPARYTLELERVTAPTPRDHAYGAPLSVLEALATTGWVLTLHRSDGATFTLRAGERADEDRMLEVVAGTDHSMALRTLIEDANRGYEAARVLP